jgi:hypothetical protein
MLLRLLVPGAGVLFDQVEDPEAAQGGELQAHDREHDPHGCRHLDGNPLPENPTSQGVAPNPPSVRVFYRGNP